MFEGNIPLYNGVWSFRLNEYLGFEVLHYIMFREQKCIKVMLTATQVCTESGTLLYKYVQNFKSFSSKEIILNLLCVPQNEHVQVLTSQ